MVFVSVVFVIVRPDGKHWMIAAARETATQLVITTKSATVMELALVSLDSLELTAILCHLVQI